MTPGQTIGDINGFHGPYDHSVVVVNTLPPAVGFLNSDNEGYVDGMGRMNIPLKVKDELFVLHQYNAEWALTANDDVLYHIRPDCAINGVVDPEFDANVLHKKEGSEAADTYLFSYSHFNMGSAKVDGTFNVTNANLELVKVNGNATATISRLEDHILAIRMRSV
jgi:hypothetical protein